jgi:hypothetical protein
MRDVRSFSLWKTKETSMPATTLPAHPTTPDHGLSRLPQTSLFRDTDAYPRWLQSSLLIGGAGMLGTPLACEAVRAGTRVKLVDMDQITDPLKIGAAYGRCGQSKAAALAEACDAINPGRAEALHADLRHVGIGVFAACTLIIDATDDPTLAGYLTKVSNGLGVPLTRVAVDGSGRFNRGRVLISHGGGGHACQMCPWDVKVLLKSLPRTPCPGAPETPPPTIASNATAGVVAGIALHNAMRLAAGDPEVFDREMIIDLDQMQILDQRLVRSAECISRHRHWTWEQVEAGADGCTLRDAFALLTARLGVAAKLEAFNHPFWTAATCSNCGDTEHAAGTWWASPPACRRCGSATKWQLGSDRAALSLPEAEQLGALDRTLAEMGLPSQGAMLIGRADHVPPVRIVLR